jgi:hypothetical protein
VSLSQHLPTDLGFILPIEGDPTGGELLVREGAKNGAPYRTYAFNGLTYPLRVPANGLPNFYNRLNTDIEWIWKDGPASKAAQAEVAKVAHLFRVVTRVLVLLPAPNVPLLLHYDPVMGNEYTPGVAFNRPGSNINAHRRHAENRHLCLKLPITEVAGNYGLPMLRHDGVTMRYEVGNRFFMINEIDILHGAGAVPHQRGILWIDGMFNLDVIDAMEKLPIPLFHTANPVEVDAFCEGGPYQRDP